MHAWAHLSPHPKRHLIGSAVFAQHTAECLYFTMGHRFSPQKYPFTCGDLDLPSNTWYLGPNQDQLHNPNGISVSLAIFAGLTTVTDRLTDHDNPSETIGHNAMRPNNRDYNHCSTQQQTSYDLQTECQPAEAGRPGH